MPKAVAEVIAHAIATDRPRLRYLVGADAEALVRGRSALSDEEVIEDGRPMSDAESLPPDLRQALGDFLTVSLSRQ